ncbi:MAG: hypothetical protein OEM00_10175 [Burkholderiaceae bacterium]|nr:hypothetical protein [Burkholderiaceae bacterium]MDH3461317.1 hypothetical protein [Burkholderiaceae bacterium]
MLDAGQYTDACNGDADGRCKVVPWRRPYEAPPATRATGLKRAIAARTPVQAQPGDRLLLCNLSMQRNRQALLRLLDQGAGRSHRFATLTITTPSSGAGLFATHLSQ